ncbi:MAG: ribosome biogenesis GTPase Der [Bacteroidota bacterium]|nr:ribosome biogenesis GTPase Der [Bacteroidota bacterium]
MGNIVAIIGRPNVGKSTFFNRLVGGKEAIVDGVSGVTRDRHYGKSDWNGVEFSVIDTGGYVHGSEDVFEEEIRKQAVIATNEADVILFLVDAKEGLTGMDQDVAKIIRRVKKKVFLVVNKADNTRLVQEASEFYALGYDSYYTISAVNGSGTGDILDAVVKEFDSKLKEETDEGIPRIAIVGRPNAGKSSIINAFIGEERNIVTPVAGTTRDTINTRYKAFDFDFYLMDTAGLRKKAKVHEDIEFYSTLRAVRAIENSDVCILMVDATHGIEAQDLTILSLIKENNKALVIVVNKWDLIEKETNTAKDFSLKIREKIAPFNDIPIIFTSALHKTRIHKTLETALEVYKNRGLRITTSQLNEFLLPLIDKTPPPATSRGIYIKIKYTTQLKTPYPAFVLFCNHPKEIKEPYRRFIENQIRKKYNFHGVPITVYFREK